MNSSESEREDRKSPVRRDEGRRPRKDEDPGWGRDAEKSRRREEDTRRKGDWKDKGGKKLDPDGKVEVKAMPRPPRKREWTPYEKRAPAGPTSEPPGDWGRDWGRHEGQQWGESWSAVTDPLPGGASSSGYEGHYYGQWGPAKWHQWGAQGLKLRPGGTGAGGLEDDWLYCRACQRHFKDQYAFNQHYRDKHQSVAPTAWAAWQRGQKQEPAMVVEDVVDESVTPQDSVSQVGLPKRQPRRKGSATKSAQSVGIQGCPSAPVPEGPAMAAASVVLQSAAPNVVLQSAAPNVVLQSVAASSTAGGTNRKSAFANFLTATADMVRALEEDEPSGSSGQRSGAK